VNDCSEFVPNFSWKQLGTSWKPLCFPPIYWFSFPLVSFERRKIGLDWEKMVRNRMVKIVGKIRPGRIVLGLGEIRVISPIGIVCLWVGIMRRPWIGRVQVFRWHLLGLKNRALFKDMIWCLTIWTIRIVKWWWVDLVDIGRLFCFHSPYPPY